MALENCLQLSTVCTTRVGAVQSHHTFSIKERQNSPLLFQNFPKKSFGSSNITTSTRKPLFVCKAKEALNQVQVATDSSWDSQVIASEYPVLVEFWAPWCGPCRMIAPVIDELAKEYSGKLECYKVNTDDCPKIATKYGIRSIPTVILFKNGEKRESVIGAVPKSTLSATIDKYIEV